MRNTRIGVGDLIKAIQVLNGCKVVAAGSMYATLEISAKARQRLTLAGIDWTYDQ